MSSVSAGSAAFKTAEDKKRAKYSDLTAGIDLVPIFENSVVSWLQWTSIQDRRHFWDSEFR